MTKKTTNFIDLTYAIINLKKKKTLDTTDALKKKSISDNLTFQRFKNVTVTDFGHLIKDAIDPALPEFFVESYF